MPPPRMRITCRFADTLSSAGGIADAGARRRSYFAEISHGAEPATMFHALPGEDFYDRQHRRSAISGPRFAAPGRAITRWLPTIYAGFAFRWWCSRHIGFARRTTSRRCQRGSRARTRRLRRMAYMPHARVIRKYASPACDEAVQRIDMRGPFQAA